MNITDFDKIISFIPITEAAIFFLLFLTLFRIHRQRHFLFIALYKFFLMAFFSMTFMFYYKMQSVVAISFYFTIPVTMALIPLFYLYADCLTTPCKNFKKSGWIHFLPSLLIAVALLPYWWLPNDEKIWFVSGGYGQSESEWIINYITWIFKFGVFVFVNFQFIVYLYLFKRLLKRHKKNIEQVFSYQENINLKWLFNLFIGFAVFFIVLYASRFFGVRYDIYNRIIFNIGFVIINLYIGIKGVIQLNIYSLIKDDVQIAESLEFIDVLPKILSTDGHKQEPIKYASSRLTDDLREQIKEQLVQYMQQRPYHKLNFNIEDIAEALNTNTRYLSQVINESFDMNFFNFVNKFRIDEAKEILLSKNNERYTIEGIAKMVGFNSKSSFNNAFKKSTGITPSEYKNINSIC